jgi:hypothetical protein
MAQVNNNSNKIAEFVIMAVAIIVIVSFMAIINSGGG